MRSLLNNNNGTLAFVVVFIILAVATVFLFAIFIPAQTEMLTTMYNAGDTIYDTVEDDIQNIQNETAKEEIQDAIETARGTIPSQITILSGFFQYGWAFIIFVIVLVVFVLARRMVEVERRGGIV